MNKQILMGLANFLPENMRIKGTQALEKALQMIDPTQIKTQQDAINVLQKLKTNGLPPDIINRANAYLNMPMANTILGVLGVNKQDFQNGLQSLNQLDNTSALTNTNSLLSGIDQL